MLDTKIIHTESEYHVYLGEIEQLLSLGANLTQGQINRLEVLTVLVEAFESKKYPLEPIDPIDAIQFRMEEKGLKQADLVQYFGTSSRVSEILKRKRPLTVQMIRALSVGLGISTDTLVGLTETRRNEVAEIDWSKFPIKEMMARGWLDKVTGKFSDNVESLVKSYISSAGLHIGTAAFRRTLSGEAKSPTTIYALYAWLARVIQRARNEDFNLGPFRHDQLNATFLRELAQLSWSDRGPQLAVEFLKCHGIKVIFEPHLKGTQLDGAAFQDIDGSPIIALTLRFDRIDNFWFTLMHEVVHVWKHISNDKEAFVDDLNVSSEDRREAEANRIAGEAFIPRIIWRRSNAYLSPSKDTIERLARELRIHPAIVAGRLHKDTGNYTQFQDMLGHHEVSSLLASS
jgi:HTH-type transcriptional regulator/antitoxin HigA